MDNAMQKKYYKQISIAPFVNKNSTLKTYLYIVIALIPQVIMLFITKSYDNLFLIFTCILACLFSEILYILKKKHTGLSVLKSILNGLLIGFFLPAGYPLVSVFFITLIVMSTVNFSFGDMTVSWINPIAVTVALCWFVGQFHFPGFLVTKNFLLEKNPSLTLIQEGIFPTFKFDEPITSFLNETIFGLFKVSIPQGYISLLWDNQSVIPAFRFNFLTLIFSVFLVAIDVIAFEIPFFFLTSYLLLVKFLSPFFSGGIQFQGDMLLALLSSGTLFCSFFLLQFFGTTPISKQGKFFYGIIGGILAFIFSGCGTSPIGSIMTVLFLNIISPVIQYFENRSMRSKLISSLRKEDA